jgi:hypothetical protein
MEKLYFDHTEDTPKVLLDADNKVFSIEGRSLPENAVEFYLPILNWLNDYSKIPNASIIFKFKLEYFNTASAKQITKLLILLQQISEKIAVKIDWHYYREDADIMASGIRFAKLINAKIELIPYDD